MDVFRFLREQYGIGLCEDMGTHPDIGFDGVPGGDRGDVECRRAQRTCSLGDQGHQVLAESLVAVWSADVEGFELHHGWVAAHWGGSQTDDPDEPVTVERAEGSTSRCERSFEAADMIRDLAGVPTLHVDVPLVQGERSRGGGVNAINALRAIDVTHAPGVDEVQHSIGDHDSTPIRELKPLVVARGGEANQGKWRPAHQSSVAHL